LVRAQTVCARTKNAAGSRIQEGKDRKLSGSGRIRPVLAAMHTGWHPLRTLLRVTRDALPPHE